MNPQGGVNASSPYRFGTAAVQVYKSTVTEQEYKESVVIWGLVGPGLE
jgi:hypothetical protein